MKYLGIDFGLSHLGFAVSEGDIAAPLKIIFKTKSRENPIDNLVKKAVEIIRLYQVENIVIGISDGPIGEISRGFGEKLHQLLGLPVFYQNEELTSVRSVQQMVVSGKRMSQRQVMDHNVAAANILQDYLDNSRIKVDNTS